jgi:4-diphosphocytidyl-2-C-methyl-D-erythritol kinase
VALAPAKLNLYLDVLGGRPDGYHELESLFAFCDLADILIVRPAGTLIFEAPTGPFAASVEHDGGNLVLKAAEMLRREAGVGEGARLDLVKHIPVAAGLGGGSADAAATLVALNTMWRLGWSVERLEQLAARLGADVPACLRGRPVIARGVGDILADAPALPPCGLLLVNPRVATPTPAVFWAFKELSPVIAPQRAPALPAAFRDLSALVAAIAPRGNDLLEAAVRVTPTIADVLAELQRLGGVRHVGLSGSGATCFALFDEARTARARLATIVRRRPGWWAWSGRFV